MNYQFEQLIEDNNLSFDELPSSVTTGINQIEKLDNAYSDSTMPQAIVNRVKQIDAKVCEAIQKHLEQEAPKGETPKDNSKGVAIENELLALAKEGVKTLTMRELKSKAPKSYSVVFEAYDEDEDNGIETSRVRLVETESETFELTTK